MSYESSSFDESIDDTIPLGTRPYLFEPKVISNKQKETTASSPQKSEMDDEERRENSEW